MRKKMGVFSKIAEDDFFEAEFSVGGSSVQTADRSPTKPNANLLVDTAPLVVTGEGRGEASEKKPAGENSKTKNLKIENPKCNLHSHPEFFWKPTNSEPDQNWICSECYRPPAFLIGEKFGGQAPKPVSQPRTVFGEVIESKPYRHIVAMGEPVCPRCRCQWVVEQDDGKGRGVIITCWTCRSLIPSTDTIWGLAERVAKAELIREGRSRFIVDTTSDDLSDI